MDHHVVGRALVVVAPLDGAGPGLPDLDGAVLRARDHPLALAVEGDAGDVAGMALERQQRVRVGGLDVVELDSVVARGGEEALVGGDAEAVDLGVGMLDRPRAYAGERLPEADRVVVTGWRIRVSVKLYGGGPGRNVDVVPVQRMTDMVGGARRAKGSLASDLAPCVGLRDSECGQRQQTNRQSNRLSPGQESPSLDSSGFLIEAEAAGRVAPIGVGRLFTLTLHMQPRSPAKVERTSAAKMHESRLCAETKLA